VKSAFHLLNGNEYLVRGLRYVSFDMHVFQV